MSCTANPPCELREVPLEDIRIAFGGAAVGRKAIAYPQSKRIFIDPAFWASVRELEARAGLLAHERGHIEGARCESCADRRAGEILRREGTGSPRDAMRANILRLENRDGVQAALDLKGGFGADGVRVEMVVDRWRAEGSDRRLLSWLDTWAKSGSFVIRVPWRGGPRTPAQQLELFAEGRELRDGKWVVVDPSKVVTYAKGPDDAPHVHAGALDVEPFIEGRAITPAEGPQFYAAIAASAEAHGLKAGLRWPKPDHRHLEVPNWKSLPLFQGSSSAELIAGAGGAVLAGALLFLLV